MLKLENVWKIKLNITVFALLETHIEKLDLISQTLNNLDQGRFQIPMTEEKKVYEFLLFEVNLASGLYLSLESIWNLSTVKAQYRSHLAKALDLFNYYDENYQLIQDQIHGQ